LSTEPLAPDTEHVPKGIRWGRILGVVLVVAVGVGGYWANERRKTNALRAQILLAYDRAVGAYRRPVARLDGKLADLVIAAAAEPWRGDHHDPIFRVAALGKGRGIYVRVSRNAAGDREELHRAARRQHSDAVAGCLAVNPALYGRLLVLGDVVAPDFRRKILEADGVTRLRALDQDFVLRAQRDLPRLADVLRPDWLIAILEGQGPPPSGAPRGAEGSAPTPGSPASEARWGGAPGSPTNEARWSGAEVHVWDLHRGRELLRLRPTLETDVVNVRWSGQGTVPSKAPTDLTVLNTVRDCAIASAIRERTGETLVTVGERPAVNVTP
jgi:hypothetical protein